MWQTVPLFSRSIFAVNYPAEWRDLATRLRALYDGSPAPAQVATLAEPTVNPYPAIWCGDWNLAVTDYAEYATLRTRLATTFPNIQWSTYVDHVLTCAGKPTATTNPQHPLKIKSAPPLVMIGNVHDYATVYQWSRTAARQSGAHLITYEGWGHTAYHRDGPSQCVNDAVDTYLITLTPPRRGLSCPAANNIGMSATHVGVQGNSDRQRLIHMRSPVADVPCLGIRSASVTDRRGHREHPSADPVREAASRCETATRAATGRRVGHLPQPHARGGEGPGRRPGPRRAPR